MFRELDNRDEQEILRVINNSARAYKGAIPDDVYHEPYMPLDELRKEMFEMTFLGWREGKHLLAVAGYQRIKDATLVRHVYVVPEHQREGLGKKLLDHILDLARTELILVGTWRAATWAIGFYEKNRFSLQPNKDELLHKYWKIPERQIELSVVLARWKRSNSPSTKLAGKV